MREVFNCQCCGVCCQGRGGIYLDRDKVAGPAALLDLTEEEFIRCFTEPRYGRWELKSDEDGFCVLHDRERHICRIHQAKPAMCRDWPFFSGMLHHRSAFEEAKEACPGIDPRVTWEEFLAYHRQHIGVMPPDSYISDPGP